MKYSKEQQNEMMKSIYKEQDMLRLRELQTRFYNGVMTGVIITLLAIFLANTASAASITAIENCIREAGAESMQGKIAVQRTVLNRVKSKRFPNSVEEVIRQPYAFSWTLDKIDKTYNYKQWLDCQKAVQTANKLGPWKFNHYYANLGKNAIKPPYWLDKSKALVQIGNHLFVEL